MPDFQGEMEPIGIAAADFGSDGHLDLAVAHLANDSAGGPRVDVIFVNDSSGGPERTARLLTHEHLAVFVAAPPSSAGFAPFERRYAWAAAPDPASPGFDHPFRLGRTCFTTPLAGGAPRRTRRAPRPRK